MTTPHPSAPYEIRVYEDTFEDGQPISSTIVFSLYRRDWIHNPHFEPVVEQTASADSLARLIALGFATGTVRSNSIIRVVIVLEDGSTRHPL